MLTEPPDLFLLTINAPEIYHFVFRITVFKNDDAIVLTGRDFPLQGKLKTGLYTIRIESSNRFTDNIIALNSDQEYIISRNEEDATAHEIRLEPPELLCAAPLDENVYESHEYYRKAAMEYSVVSTLHTGIAPEEGSLFIFMRYPSLKRYNDLQSSGIDQLSVKWPFPQVFELQNDKGRPLCTLDEEGCSHIGKKEGWVAFNACLKPGSYFLVCKNSRQIPVYIFKGLHTQLFLTIDEEPLFSTMRMFVSQKRAFNPYDPVNKYTDILFQRLEYKDFSPDYALMTKVAKCRKSPLLSLLQAYFALFIEDALTDVSLTVFEDACSEIRKWPITDSVMLPDFPALYILSQLRRKESSLPPGMEKPVRGIPLLRVGFEAVKQQAVNHPDLIKEGSLNDFVTECLVSDTAFTSFHPLGIKIDEFERRQHLPVWTSRPAAAARPYQSWHPPHTIMDRPQPIDRQDTILQMLDDKAIYVLLKSPKSDYLNWLGVLIREAVDANPGIRLDALAKDLQISVTTVRRKIKDISKNIYNDLMAGNVSAPVTPQYLQTTSNDLAILGRSW